MLTLESERLILRDFQPDDFRAFFESSNDPEHQRFHSESETTEAFCRHIFDRFLAGAEAPERKIFQLAVCLHSGELIGTCGIRIENSEDKQASFGYGIARAQWGKGLAYEATRRLLGFGFSSLPIHRIYAETISENKRSRALAERLGMRLEGEFKENRYFRGRWWDTVIYAILKGKWKIGAN